MGLLETSATMLARTAFVPTLAYNVLMERISSRYPNCKMKMKNNYRLSKKFLLLFHSQDVVEPDRPERHPGRAAIQGGDVQKGEDDETFDVCIFFTICCCFCLNLSDRR